MSEGTTVIKCLLTVSLMNCFVRGDPFLLDQEDGRASLPQTSHTNTLHTSSTQNQLYSPWSQWSPCSTTCGRGISMRTRICNKRQTNSRGKDEPLCHAESVEHKICQLQDCPPGTPDFRSFQCSQYNDRLVAGQLSKSWVPTNGGANPCELRCKAEVEKSVYVFGKAVDGTSCAEGVCLDGRCLQIGCDDRLGSGAELDMCGLCSGRNATCVHYTDLYDGQPTSALSSENRGEYQEVVTLPVGARNFKLWKDTGDNILAIRDRTTALIFHRNSAQMNQALRVAGTYVVYSIENNSTEVLTAKGPTVTDLYVLVLLREKNPGIHYQYWLPLEPSHRNQIHPVNSLGPALSSDEDHGDQTPLITIAQQPTPPLVSTTPRPSYASAYWTSAAKTTKPTQIYPIRSPLKPKAKTPPPGSNIPNYGPKRLGLAIPPKPLRSPSNRNLDSSSESSVAFTAANVGHVPRPKNSFVPVYKLNYKTRKPVFNYYEKYRNSSSQSSVNAYERKSVYLPQQTQGDSSAPNDGKNEAVPKGEKKLKLKGKKSELGYRNKTLSSRWEYKINGKDNHSLGTNLLNPPVSITVLPLPDSFNASHSRKGSKHFSKSRQSRGGLCEPCYRVRDMTSNFCSSDFVVRVSILAYEFLHGETRYELEIQQSFRNILALLPREYVWSPDTCRCPKLRIGKEYILMGKIDNNYRRNESRLLVDKSCFVRLFNGKHARRLQKLRKNHARKCSKLS